MPNEIYINRHLCISQDELGWRFTRASGPGGQNVNRTSTRVEVAFDIAHSPSLSEPQRQMLLERLGRLIDVDGVLHLSAQSERSQWQNRRIVLAKLSALLSSALTERKPRRAKRVPRSSRERRLQAKRKIQQKKAFRRAPVDEE